jgi:hypothetical protein
LREDKFITRFWWGNLIERDHLGDPDVNESHIDVKEIGWDSVTGLIWLWTGISSEIL